MNNSKSISDLIKATSGQANILAIPRIYIDLLDGDINSAILLSQIVYWSDKSSRNDGWFYKSYSEWHEEIGLTQYKVSRSIEMLKKKELVMTMLKKANGSPTLHYKIDIELLSKSIIEFLHNGLSSNLIMDYEVTSQSLTETTSEITTEITTKKLVVEAAKEKNIFQVYTDEIGILTPMVREGLLEIEKEYPAGWFEKAVKEAHKSTQNINMRYLESILKRWKSQGLPFEYSEVKPKNNGKDDVMVRDDPISGLREYWQKGKIIKTEPIPEEVL